MLTRSIKLAYKNEGSNSSYKSFQIWKWLTFFCKNGFITSRIKNSSSYCRLNRIERTSIELTQELFCTQQ